MRQIKSTPAASISGFLVPPRPPNFFAIYLLFRVPIKLLTGKEQTLFSSEPIFCTQIAAGDDAKTRLGSY
jgi:hypothetical protein